MAPVTIWEFLADIDPLAILETAKWRLEDDDDCPEWIKIFANGDLELWPAVLDEARIEYELMQREAEQEKE